MTNLKIFCYHIFCGFFLGISAFAPGFSGSVMAITMGIYSDLVRIMSNPFKEIRKNLSFFIALAIGIAISGILFVLAFSALIERYPRATLLLFVGLILGNLPMIAQEVKKVPFQKRYLIGGLLAFALALTLTLFGFGVGHATGADTEGILLLRLVFAGFIAGAITLVPGMSISAILIMLGAYGPLIAMVRGLLGLNWNYLPPFFGILLTAALGLVLTARLIKRIFKRFPGFANACIFGFMSGTLIGIFMESLDVYDPGFTWLQGGLTFAAGLGASFLFILLGKKMGKKTERYS